MWEHNCPTVSKKNEFASFWQKSEDHLNFDHINIDCIRNKFHLLVQGITCNTAIFIGN